MANNKISEYVYMHVLNINSEKDASKVDKIIKQGNNVFMLVYMEGCGPCNATRPEWAKIKSALSDQYEKNNKLYVIDINKDYASNVKYIGSIDGFPTMKYFGNNGSKVENYEDSGVKKKDRSVTSFINWIESHVTNSKSTAPNVSSKNVYNRLMKKSQTKKQSGGYKRSRSHKRSGKRRRTRRRMFKA